MSPPDAPRHPRAEDLTLKRQSRLVQALERAWAEVMERHDELPPVAIIVGQGSGHRGGGLVLGHFAAERWQPAGSDDVYVHELMIGGEGLRRGAAAVFATLLHEAAHALARVRGIQDTSRQGRYHNKRFKQLGAELGLVIERDPRIGWSLTTLPPTTAERYAAAIDTLERAIALHRRNEPTAGGGDRSGNLLAAACQCPRRIRIAPRTLADGPIVCTVCAHAFEPVKP
jgi:hypothetical protein